MIINEDDEKEVENLVAELSSYNLNLANKSKLIEFEKDDPTNYHI